MINKKITNPKLRKDIEKLLNQEISIMEAAKRNNMGVHRLKSTVESHYKKDPRLKLISWYSRKAEDNLDKYISNGKKVIDDKCEYFMNALEEINSQIDLELSKEKPSQSMLSELSFEFEKLNSDFSELKKRYREPISLSEIGRRSNLSRMVISTIFSKSLKNFANELAKRGFIDNDEASKNELIKKIKDGLPH